MVFCRPQLQLKSRAWSLPPLALPFLPLFFILPFISCHSYGGQSGKGGIRIRPGIFRVQPKQRAEKASAAGRSGRACGRDSVQREGTLPPGGGVPAGPPASRGSEQRPEGWILTDRAGRSPGSPSALQQICLKRCLAGN